MLRAFTKSSKKRNVPHFVFVFFYTCIEPTNKLQRFKSKPQRGSERNRENTLTHTLVSTHRTLILFSSRPNWISLLKIFRSPQTWLPRFNTNTALNLFLFSSNHSVHLKGYLCKLIWCVLRCLLLLPIHFVGFFQLLLFLFLSVWLLLRLYLSMVIKLNDCIPNVDVAN